MKKPKSFKTKLWLYFALFTAIIFSLLWLMQTVFLQSFYNQMLIGNTKTAAQTIVKNADKDNINGIIDEVAHDNSLLIFVTDKDGNILYISDEYKSAHRQKENGGFKNGGKMEGKHKGEYRDLPEGYDEFLAQLNASENGMTESTDDSLYVYGAMIDYQGSECALYVSATLNAVGSAVTIIRIQLAVVTIFSLIIGFILAWFIAKRFSKPVSQLSDKAKKLGEEDFSGEYHPGFCAELDELNSSLDKTSGQLQQSRSFQNELLANVSHDLRTPLTMIKGYAEEIGDYSWQDEEQRKKDAAIIIREADRLTALVNEILEYSELQAQDDTKDFAPVDFSALVNRVADNFEALYQRDGYKIEREIEDELTINGSAQKLERMVVNLLDNAVRHTGDCKTVTVRLSRDNGAKLQVIDCGEGISAEDLPHIWEKYYTNRQRGGKGVSGLGLAIVKQIVTLHRGSCTAESEPHKGSTFTVTIPTAAQ